MFIAKLPFRILSSLLSTDVPARIPVQIAIPLTLLACVSKAPYYAAFHRICRSQKQGALSPGPLRDWPSSTPPWKRSGSWSEVLFKGAPTARRVPLRM